MTIIEFFKVESRRDDIIVESENMIFILFAFTNDECKKGFVSDNSDSSFS